MKVWAIVAVVTMALISACTKPKDLEFVDLANIRMIKWGLTESLVGVDVRIYNPNNRSVKMKEAVAKVYANSTYLGDSRFDSLLTVPRKDTFLVPVTFKVQTMTAVTKLIETLSDTTVTFRVEGTVKMGKAGVFITYPIRVEQQVKSLEEFQKIN